MVSEKLAIFGAERIRRMDIASIYQTRLDGLTSMQSVPANSESGNGLFTIRIEHRANFRNYMQEHQIPTAVYYDTSLHSMEAFKPWAPADGLPNCEAAAREVVSIPMHPYMSDAQAHRVCDVVETFKRKL